MVLLTACALLTLPGAARAQDDGVHVDPDSPTGTEYAIPLGRARRDTSGDPAARRESSTSVREERFGEGISATEPDDTSARKGTTAKKSKSRRTTPPSTQPEGEGAVQLASASTGSAWEWSLLLAIGVLAAGALLGIALRRLARRERP